jgi:hypothetical protein
MSHSAGALLVIDPEEPAVSYVPNLSYLTERYFWLLSYKIRIYRGNTDPVLLRKKERE